MKETKTMNARPLSVVGVDIAQDDHGRYSLNDLHRAAMAAGSATESHKPGNFMQSAGVQAFLDALEASDLTAGIPAIKTEPGRYGGTYGARLVVLRYAAWIAPAFEVQVSGALLPAVPASSADQPSHADTGTPRPTRRASSSAPMLFNFDGLPVRSLRIKGEPWFVAADLAAVLEYRNAPDMTRSLDDDEKGTQIVRTPGGDQEMTIISESGLYAAILKSRKPEARQFRRWVTGEVLPSIRKTGGYKMDDHARRVRDVFNVAGEAVKARGLRGPARDAAVRCVLEEIAPDLLHLVPDRPPLKGAPEGPSPADLVAVVRDWLIQHGPELPDLLALRAAAAATPGQRMAAADFMDEARGEYVISPHTFASVICKGWNAVAVAAALRDAGHLVHEAGRLTRSRRFPGGSLAKCYTVRAALLS